MISGIVARSVERHVRGRHVALKEILALQDQVARLAGENSRLRGEIVRYTDTGRLLQQTLGPDVMPELEITARYGPLSSVPTSLYTYIDVFVCLCLPYAYLASCIIINRFQGAPRCDVHFFVMSSIMIFSRSQLGKNVIIDYYIYT